MACNSINSTLELFSLALLLLAAVSVLLKKRGNRQDRLLLAVLFLHLVNTVGDLAAWRLTSIPSAIHFTIAGNFLTYFFAPMAYTGLFLLVYQSITSLNSFGKKELPFMILMGAACIFSMSLIFVNQFTGILFSIDSQNNFTWGPYSALPDDISLVQSLVLLPLLLFRAESSKARALSLYLLYCGPFTAAAALEHLYPTLMLLYPTTTFLLLLIYIRNSQELEKKMLRQELELSDSRTRLLLGQIQPHFIFNSLLAIEELCEEDPKKAGQSVQDFAQYLRSNLEALSCSHLIPFEKELDHIRHYLALEQADPSSQFQVVWDLETTAFAVPPLSVQPLVENAVRHGIAGQEDGILTIRSRECHRDNQKSCSGKRSEIKGWVITIEDNGCGFSHITEQQKKRQSTGIQNVKIRLATQCGGSLSYGQHEQGTCAIITIPKRS